MKRAQKRKVRQFLGIKEVIMTFLVILSFVWLALEHFERLDEAQLRLAEAYEVIVGAIFLGEFIFEWYYALDQSKYIRHHWFYLIAAIPVPTASFELLKGVRLLRLLKLFKIFAEYRYERNTRLFSEK